MVILRRLVTLLAVLPLMAGTRCIDEKDISPADLPKELPPVTQLGVNTFGFVIDGRVWRDYGVVCNGTLRCDSNRVRVQRFASGPPEYDLRAALSTKQHNEFIGMQLLYVRQPGVYGWSSGRPQPAASLTFTDASATPIRKYMSRRSIPFYVSVTRLDTVQRIIAGVFAGTFSQDTDSTKTVVITDGRFDVRYRQ